MFDFLKSLFGKKDEEMLEKVASMQTAKSISINETNNSAVKKASITDKTDNDNAQDELLFRNEKDGKYGYVNAKGEQIVECKFDWVYDFKEGLAAVKKDGKYGYINTKGEQIVECKFDGAYNFNEGLAAVKKDGKWFNINIKGDFVAFDKDDNRIIEAIKKVSDKSGNAFLLSKSDDKFGLLDPSYNILIKNKLYGEFEVVQRMNENTFLIKMAEKEFFIDSNGDFK